jgi:hypothetical protein
LVVQQRKRIGHRLEKWRRQLPELWQRELSPEQYISGILKEYKFEKVGWF